MDKKKHEVRGKNKKTPRKWVLPADADEYTRFSSIIMGRIKPETEHEKRIFQQAEEIAERGNAVDMLFN